MGTIRAMLAVLMAVIMLGMAVPVTASQGGEVLPDFSVITFEGERLSRADLLGHPLMLVFWTTWCPNCEREIPRINKAAAELGPKGLKVLAINVGINDSEERARAYQKKHGLHYPVAFDHGFEMTGAFRIFGVPTVIMVDVGGMVRYRHPLLPDNMDAWFEKLKKGESTQ